MYFKKYIPKTCIYLDNAATTIPYKYCNIFNNMWYNSSSNYNPAIKNKKRLYTAQSKIAKIFNISQKNVFFTSGATEANNWIIQTYIDNHIKEYGEGDYILVSPIEHPSVLNIFRQYESKGLIKIEYFDINRDGTIILSNLLEKIHPNTFFVSCMYVNNEVGNIQPISFLGNICKDFNLPLHVDATQAIGKINIDMKKSNITFLTFSAHKFHGPKMIGCLLYNDRNIKNVINPLLFGGHQQHGYRPGTENVHDICFMAELLYNNNQNNYILKTRRKSILFYNYIIKMMEKYFKNNEYIINSMNSFIPIVNISFKNITGEYLVCELNEKRIYVSTGSACTTGDLEPSHVLSAMGIPAQYIQGTLRISFDPDTITKRQIRKTIKTIYKIIHK